LGKAALSGPPGRVVYPGCVEALERCTTR
jgi:hypothetical protein